MCICPSFPSASFRKLKPASTMLSNSIDALILASCSSRPSFLTGNPYSPALLPFTKTRLSIPITFPANFSLIIFVANAPCSRVVSPSKEVVSLSTSTNLRPSSNCFNEYFTSSAEFWDFMLLFCSVLNILLLTELLMSGNWTPGFKVISSFLYINSYFFLSIYFSMFFFPYTLNIWFSSI